MPTLGLSVANDIASAALLFYVRGKALSQTTQDKPLLKWLRDGQKSFPGGNLQISEPVQFTYMQDTAGFLQGISTGAGDDQLVFAQAANLLRAVVNWKVIAANLIIAWVELLKDGITIVDDSKGGRTSEHTDVSLTRLTGILENRLEDFGESWSRALNLMLWQDGTQDANQVPGIRSLITDAPTTNVSVEGINQVTYAAWQNRANLNVVTSTINTTGIRFLNTELIQLRRFGGKPNKALCGSTCLDLLRGELVAKGYFTQTGFAGEKATDLGVSGLHISGIGKLEYDPSLDSQNLANRMYVLASNDVKLRPIEGEDNKMLSPERPYQYLVFLKTMTWAGALMAKRRNSCAVYAFS